MAAGDGGGVVSSSLLLAWDVPPDQEEPWRRFLQELSESRYEEYAQSRRRLGILTEWVWLAPKPSGGGVAIVCLKADNPEWALRELAASEAPFDSWYGRDAQALRLGPGAVTAGNRRRAPFRLARGRCGRA